MGEKQTKEQPPIPVLEGRVGAELDRAQGGDLRAMVNSLCKQLRSECTQLGSGRGAAHPGRRKSRVPADDSEPGSPRPLPLCCTAALPRGPSTPAALTHSLPCTFQECPARGKWGLSFQGECAAPGGCQGRWGSSACGSWLWLLQDAVMPLAVFPGLLSLLGTSLHLQLYVGRTIWGFPDSAIIIIILGNFSAGAHGWEGAASPGWALPASLWRVAVPAVAAVGLEARSCMILLQALRYQKRLCPCTQLPEAVLPLPCCCCLCWGSAACPPFPAVSWQWLVLGGKELNPPPLRALPQQLL